ncbi:hypothetical protein NBRC116599_41420 [Aquicoccus sp. SU-CL01552]
MTGASESSSAISMRVPNIGRSTSCFSIPVTVQSVFPELQWVPGAELDQSRSTWVLMYGDLCVV